MFLKIEKKFAKIPNGENIAYVEKGTGDKVVVLVHGNFSSSYHYEPLYKNIPDDYRVIAPDLRGYGDSSYNTPINTLHELADDVVALLKKLKVKKAVFVGWSLGGCVVQSIAARYNKLVEKLVLVASGSCKGYPVFKKDASFQNIIGATYANKEELALDPVTVAPMVNTQRTKNYKFMEQIWNMTIYTGPNKPDEESSAIFLEETCKQVNLVDADWALMTFNISNETSFYSSGEDIAKNITCPVLAINGRLDITVPEIMTSENRTHIPGLVQKYYANAGHSILVDDIESLTKDILEFVNA